MKAVIYSGPEHFTVTETPTPTPGPYDALIRTELAGLCGTDLHIHSGDFAARFPLTPGHEVVGVVEAVGAQVSRVKPGQRVTVNANINCGLCDYCRAGRPTLCDRGEALGVTRPGFFAEYAVAPERLVHPVGDLASEIAVFIEPTACAMHGLEVLQLRPGGSAVVIGAGPTGLMLAQLLAVGGAASVTVAAPSQHKLATAKALGIDHTLLIDRNDPAGALQALLAMSPTGDGYDTVVEATGSPTIGEICVPLARRGGQVLIYGVTRPGERVSIDPFDVFRREITIKGSFAEMTSFDAAIAMLTTGRVKTTGIASHVIPLDQFEQALHTLQHDRGAHKVVVKP